VIADAAFVTLTRGRNATPALGDIDGDGDLDLFIGESSGDINFYRNEGSAAEPRFELVADKFEGIDGGRRSVPSLVDIDGDGDLDVVISNDTPDRKLVHLNDGRGGFTAGSTFGRPEWPTRHVSLADLNGDDLPDIVVANRSGDRGGLNYVCFNRGEGRFDDDCLGFSRESATTITPADFNGDGRIDLGVPHREGGQSYIYLNDAEHRFGERIPFGPADAGVRQAEAADLNGDGALDLVVIDERKGAAAYMAGEDGAFGEGVPLGEAGPTPYALAVGDLDRDGRPDVIVGYVNARPVAFFGDGAGGFTAVPFGDDEGVAYGFAIGDIDEDGVLDIAMARSDAPNILYFGSPRSAAALR
jgi:hypothetical protein